MSFSVQELFYAYRRAKSDARFERTQNAAIAFTEYEQNLSSRIETLTRRLNEGNGHLFESSDECGSILQIPKAHISQAPVDPMSYADPDEYWDKTSPHVLELRPFCWPTVEVQIVSALWLMRVGRILDSRLSAFCYANRLRRSFETGEPNIVAYSSFQHYAHRYREWRDSTLSAARSLLEKNERATIITFDIRACYASISADKMMAAVDPLLLELDDKVISAVLHRIMGVFNTQLNQSGLPIGLTTSSVLANYALSSLDEALRPRESIVHYGRYVDDIALVVRGAGCSTPSEVLSLLTHASGGAISAGDSGDWRIRLVVPNEVVGVAASKTKIIRLVGDAGLATLAAIEDEGTMIASEWRLMPQVRPFGRGAILTQFSKRPEVNTARLRDLDSTTLHKLQFSIALRHLEVLAKYLPAKSARELGEPIINSALQHAICAQYAADFFCYWKRIAILALRLGDEGLISRFFARLTEAMNRLSGSIASRHTRSQFQLFIAESMLEALVCAHRDTATSAPFLERLRRFADEAGLRIPNIPATVDALNDIHRQVFWADLAAESIAQLVLSKQSRAMPSSGRHAPSYAPQPSKEALEFCREVGRKHKISGAALWRSLSLSTRPPRWHDIFRASARARDDDNFASSVLSSFRGTTSTFKSDLTDKPKLRIGLTSFDVSHDDFQGGAVGIPILTAERFDRIAELVRQAQTHRVNVLVFPELSIPRDWISLVEDYLGDSGISLVAGIEYRHDGADSNGARLVTNEAAVSIVERARGDFFRWRPTRQPKTQPAIAEAQELWHLPVRCRHTERRRQEVVRTYRHQNVKLAIFICSELTDVAARAELRGRVDVVIALEFNRDINSFRALVESTAIDLHCFVVQCNNRHYGDSRIRSPAREEHARDLAVLRGGTNDQLVVVDLPIQDLREFQRRLRIDLQERPSPETRTVTFKPTPDGWIDNR